MLIRSGNLRNLSLLGVMAAAVALAGTVGCNSGRGPQVETETAEQTTLEVVLEEVGVVESTNVRNINSPFSGRIVQIVENGTAVRQGDVVAVLDTQTLEEDIERQIENLRATKNDMENAIENMRMTLRSNSLDISSSQADLDMTRVELANVNQELSELEYLRSRDLVAEDDVRSAAYRLRTSEISTFQRDMNLRGQVTGSQSSEMNNQTRVERISLRAGDTLRRIGETAQRIEVARIEAPVDGLFLRHSRWDWRQRRTTERQPGEEVGEGERLGEIPDINALIVRSQIPESEMLNVQIGTPVDLNFEALGNLEIPGTVQAVAPMAIERETSAGGQITAGGDELTGEKVFEIEIALERQDERLRPGLSARARFLLDRRESVLTIPLEAINTSSEGTHFVHVMNGNQREQRTVSVGQANANRVEILDGLTAGERVIVGGSRES